MPAPEQITPIDSDYARFLTMSKRQLLDASGVPGLIQQAGGAYLPTPVSIPQYDGPTDNEIIETFLLEARGNAVPVGDNEPLIEMFGEAVAAAGASLIETLTAAGVSLVFPGYLTVAINPIALVSSQPHFDDEQFDPEAGVGLVAILSTIAGTSFARAPLPCGPTHDGHPLNVSSELVDTFWNDAVLKQTSAPGEFVVMPQFAHLHAGPRLDPDVAHRTRTTIVVRFATTPKYTG